MKFCRRFFIFILCFFLLSCVSTVPGEKAVILKNLSAEYFNIAENYLAQEKYSKAIDNYNLSLRTANQKDKNQIKYQLAKAYALNKNYNEAQDIFFELYEQEKSNTILVQSLAFCYGKNGKIDEALTLYKDIYLENPSQEDVANNYFLLLLEAKQIDEAKSVLEKFKTDFPESKKLSALEKNFEKATEVPKETETSEPSSSEIEEKTKN